MTDPLYTLQAYVVTQLCRDLSATLGADLRDRVAAEAAHARTFISSPDDYVERVVDGVQQSIHDEFLDTAWPRCPSHPNHPLWYAAGFWRCEQDHAVIAPLGQLGQL